MDEDTKTRLFYSLETIVNKLPQIMQILSIIYILMCAHNKNGQLLHVIYIILLYNKQKANREGLLVNLLYSKFTRLFLTCF